MAQSENRVAKYQPWPGKAHHFFDSFPHDGLVAVDDAAATNRFVFLEAAMVEAIARVIE